MIDFFFNYYELGSLGKKRRQMLQSDSPAKMITELLNIPGPMKFARRILLSMEYFEQIWFGLFMIWDSIICEFIKYNFFKNTMQWLSRIKKRRRCLITYNFLLCGLTYNPHLKISFTQGWKTCEGLGRDNLCSQWDVFTLHFLLVTVSSLVKLVGGVLWFVSL